MNGKNFTVYFFNLIMPNISNESGRLHYTAVWSNRFQNVLNFCAWLTKRTRMDTTKTVQINTTFVGATCTENADRYGKYGVDKLCIKFTTVCVRFWPFIRFFAFVSKFLINIF